MGSILAYGKLAKFFEPCILFNYNPDGLSWSEIFLLVDFIWIPTVFGSTWAMTVIMKELFFFFIAMAITADWFINFGLQLYVGASTNIQPPVCPIVSEQMPAYVSEFVTLSLTLVLGMTILLYKRAISASLIIMLIVLSEIVVYGRIYLLFSTPTQLLVGAMVGFVEAVVYLVALAVMKHFKIDRAMISAPQFLRWYSFTDTIMYPNEPTLIGTRVPKSINYKIYPGDDMDDYSEEPVTISEDDDHPFGHDTPNQVPPTVESQPMPRFRFIHLYDPANGIAARE